MRVNQTIKKGLFAGLALFSFAAIDAQAHWGPQDRDYSWECRNYQGRERYERGEQPRARRIREYRDNRQNSRETSFQNQPTSREISSNLDSQVPERRPIFTGNSSADATGVSINKPAVANNDVFQFIMTQPGLTRFARALEASGLLNDLRGGTYTLFVPVDNAFSKATTFEFEDLLKPENKNRLRDLVAYHISQGQAMSNTPLREARSINGKKLQIRSQDSSHKMTVNGVEVIDADLIGSNGVVHIIGKVLVP